MAIDTIKSSAVLDGAIATADIADDAVTGAKIENNPTIAGNATISGSLSAKGGAVFNEDSNNVNFRVESNNDANMFVVDGTSDIVKIGSNAGAYGSLSIRTESAGSQERGLYIESAPASGTSPNNVAVFSAANSNMTQPLVRIHHESPTADQLLLQATTTGSNTVKFSVDEDGDIYSAGGINLGGTGAANKLDDYEEGTWSAELRGASARASTPVISTTAKYRKIGDLVFVAVYFPDVNTSGASGNLQITGFPFPAINQLFGLDVQTYGQDYDDAGGVISVKMYIENNSSATLLATKDNAAWQVTGITAGSGKYVQMQGCYLTAS